jgi:hypothetical protein
MQEEIELKWSFGTVYSLLFMYVYELGAWGLPSLELKLKTDTHTDSASLPHLMEVISGIRQA